jgi:hypothetical protein
MEQQIEKRVTKLISDQQKELEEQTGSFSDEVTEKETKDYVELVLNEKKRLSTAD